MEKNSVSLQLNGENFDIGVKHYGRFYLEFDKTLIYLEALGKCIYPNFQLDSKDKPLYRLLFGYFTEDVEFCHAKKIDLTKGILLYGSTGVGKTVILKLFTLFIANFRHKTDFYTMQSISVMGNEHGSQFLNHINFKRDLILDDIGSESMSIHYGDRFESLKLIINKYEEINFSLVIPDELSAASSLSVNRISSTRNNSGKTRKIYATTNLDANMLKDRYGERVTSRFSDYFNVIPFVSQIDKRTANANIIKL